jgi:hypothetical protein
MTKQEKEKIEVSLSDMLCEYFEKNPEVNVFDYLRVANMFFNLGCEMNGSKERIIDIKHGTNDWSNPKETYARLNKTYVKGDTFQLEWERELIQDINMLDNDSW